MHSNQLVSLDVYSARSTDMFYFDPRLGSEDSMCIFREALSNLCNSM